MDDPTEEGGFWQVTDWQTIVCGQGLSVTRFHQCMLAHRNVSPRTHTSRP